MMMTLRKMRRGGGTNISAECFIYTQRDTAKTVHKTYTCRHVDGRVWCFSCTSKILR